MPDLKKALYDAVADAGDKVGVAFSGGVDSSLLAKICQDLGKDTTLLTVGFPGSPDTEFAKKVAAKMGLQQRTAELRYQDFRAKMTHVRKSVKCENTSHLENCVAYYYVAKLARQNELDIVLTANGCDELFCGYNAYRLVYDRGEKAVMKLMEEKIANELELVKEISAVASEFDVQVKQPFLSPAFVRFAKSIPLDQKIKGAGDLMRKHILRQAALSIGVPEECAMKPKKALQYGSLIHKYYKKASA